MNEEKISMLERYGDDLTKKEYITDPAIARDEEITDIVDTFMLPNAKVEDEDIKEKIKLYINEAL